MSMSEKTYNFPVWGTQGGGLVRKVGESYIFVEGPTCPGLSVGSELPKEWDLIPANDLVLASKEMEEFKEFERGFNNFFNECLRQKIHPEDVARVIGRNIV